MGEIVEFPGRRGRRDKAGQVYRRVVGMLPLSERHAIELLALDDGDFAYEISELLAAQWEGRAAEIDWSAVDDRTSLNPLSRPPFGARNDAPRN